MEVYGEGAATMVRIMELAGKKSDMKSIIYGYNSMLPLWWRDMMHMFMYFHFNLVI